MCVGVGVSMRMHARACVWTSVGDVAEKGVRDGLLGSGCGL